jgi:DNA-binding HxlR family transcriptional regulator
MAAKASGKRAVAEPRSECPVGKALDLLGDRWTLLVIRDMAINGERTYNEFLAAPENIPTNTLALRLKRLEEASVVVKEPYQQNPPRYTYKLTDKGRDLLPVLRSLRDWSLAYGD